MSGDMKANRVIAWSVLSIRKRALSRSASKRPSGFIRAVNTQHSAVAPSTMRRHVPNSTLTTMVQRG